MANDPSPALSIARMRHDAFEIECAARAGRLSLTKIRRPPPHPNARTEAQLLRELGLVSYRETDALGLLRGGKVRDDAGARKHLQRGDTQASKHLLQMHLPATRTFRPETPDGRTGFYFDHQVIAREHPAKAAVLAKAAGPKKPRASGDIGAAHSAYVERESAVASTIMQSIEEGGAAELTIERTAAEPIDVEHGRYIERDPAVARQPDGSRVLFTNIDDDPEVRNGFWLAVERMERVPQPDAMTIRWTGHEELWRSVLQDSACPLLLAGGIRAAMVDGEAKIETVANEPLRAWLYERTPSWGKDDDPEVNRTEQRQAWPGAWHDGRGGRIQYRVVGELPAELDLAGRAKALAEFAAEFEKRKLPYVLVLHEPDYTNSDANWHFHLIYHDRPARRLSNGRWDFEQKMLDPTLGIDPVPYGPGKTKVRSTFPYRQAKLAEPRERDKWIKTLRGSYAAVVNEALAAAGERRRLDPRRGDELDLVSSDQEHLGTHLHALKTYGVATRKEICNERRQNAAIVTHHHRAHARTVAEIKNRSAKLLNDLHRADLPAAQADAYRRSLEDAERKRLDAAELDLIAILMRNVSARATSRADQGLETSARYLGAISAGRAKAADVARKGDMIALQRAAGEYLTEVQPFIAARGKERDAIARDATSLRAQAAAEESEARRHIQEAGRAEGLRRGEPVALHQPAPATAGRGASPLSGRTTRPEQHRAIDRLIAQIRAAGCELLVRDREIEVDWRDAIRLGIDDKLLTHDACQRRLKPMLDVQRRYHRRTQAWLETDRSRILRGKDDSFEFDDTAPGDLRRYVQEHKADRLLQRMLADASDRQASNGRRLDAAGIEPEVVQLRPQPSPAMLIRAANVVAAMQLESERLFGPQIEDRDQPLVERALSPSHSTTKVIRDRHGIVVEPLPAVEARMASDPREVARLIRRLDDDGWRIRIGGQGQPAVPGWEPSLAEKGILDDEASWKQFVRAAEQQTAEIANLGRDIYLSRAARRTPTGIEIDAAHLHTDDPRALRWAGQPELTRAIEQALEVMELGDRIRRRRKAQEERTTAGMRCREATAMDMWRIAACQLAAAGAMLAIKSRVDLPNLRQSQRDHIGLAGQISAEQERVATNDPATIAPVQIGRDPAYPASGRVEPEPFDCPSPKAVDTSSRANDLAATSDRAAAPQRAEPFAREAEQSDRANIINALLQLTTPGTLGERFAEAWQDVVRELPFDPDMTRTERNRLVDEQAAIALLEDGSSAAQVAGVLRTLSAEGRNLPPTEAETYVEERFEAIRAIPALRGLFLSEGKPTSAKQDERDGRAEAAIYAARAAVLAGRNGPAIG